MTPEQQRIAIAEACGWVESPYGKWSNDGLILCDPLNPPDYLNDLNAMHEAEKMLTDLDLNLYRQFLYMVVLEDPSNASNEPAWSNASQRAEAFLGMLGLWKP
jgi:hypothetical protein